MEPKKFVNTTNARQGHHYKKVIEKIARQKVCPFCQEHILKYHKNPIDEKKYWLVTDNMYPYSPVKHHIIFIHKKHTEKTSEITPEAWQELFESIKETEKKKGITGGTFLLRFGDTNFTGASVTHLHAHLVQSNPSSEKYNKKTGLTARIG